MSADSTSLPVSVPDSAVSSATVGTATRLYWSMRREIWENRSIYIAPLAVATLALLGFGISLVQLPHTIRETAALGGMEQRTALIRPYTFSAYLLMATTFIVSIFYCLDALQGERRDRSVLFWKSLPVSDRDTVVSKGISALLVAPILALGASLITMVAFMLILSVVVLLHGGNPFTLLWGPGNPLSVVGAFLIGIPVYALWALPTAGWLLLCSAWARSKPFLWAIMIPVFSGILVSWFDLTKLFNMDSSWYWKHIVGRSLLGTFPGSDLLYQDAFNKGSGDVHATLHQLSATSALNTLSSPELWIGAVAGLVMIYGAIRLRRWRDDN
jgi:ABC-2 type transport system permease protein